MSVAGTTLLIIVLLLPGVFFFIGFSLHERYSKEVVKSSAASDVGLAVLFAIVVHSLAWLILTVVAGFDLAAWLKPLGDADTAPRWIVIDQAVSRLPKVLAYVFATALFGLISGWCAARLIVAGWFRFLVNHKWAYDIIGVVRDKEKAVTAFVMTSTVQNNRALMYKGRLQEFYLNADGQFTYLVLRNCSRYYMKLDGDSPTTGEQLPLFTNEQPVRTWNYLIVSGDNIANVLIEPTPEIQSSPEGEKALENALRKRPRRPRGYPNERIGG